MPLTHKDCHSLGPPVENEVEDDFLRLEDVVDELSFDRILHQTFRFRAHLQSSVVAQGVEHVIIFKLPEDQVEERK